MKIAVLGAGISGLAAAYRLTRSESNCPTVHLYERQDRVGGVLDTLNRDGFQIEQSADNFITTVPWGIQLCKELGLEQELVQTNPEIRRTYVVRRGRLHLLPDGFLMMAPTKLWPMAVTPILSPLGKLRAAMELVIPARKDDEDETMAQFVQRRLGQEVFQRLVEPLVSGVYAADMDKLSVLATLPRFREMERDHGSLIKAMRSQLAANRSANLATQSGARYSMFVTLKSGLSSLCQAMAKRLPPETLKLGHEIVQIQRNADGRWILRTGDGQEEYDALVIATSSHHAASLLTGPAPELAALLATIQHEGTAIATFAFDRDQMKRRVKGMGFVVPKVENSPVLAGSFSSLKYQHRAPDGKLLIRIFAGGARAPEFAEMEQEKLVPLLLKETRRFLDLRGEPDWVTVAHWPKTMPQYHLGHRELVRKIEQALDREPSLAVAGNAFHGVGVPNCIRSGMNAAEKILHLQ